MTRLEVIVLEKFLVLQVAILGLQSVELVAQGKVVLVALFNLEDLGLELRDQQVFLVAGQMHAIVVLNKSKIAVKFACLWEAATKRRLPSWVRYVRGHIKRWNILSLTKLLTYPRHGV